MHIWKLLIAFDNAMNSTWHGFRKSATLQQLQAGAVSRDASSVGILNKWAKYKNCK